MEFTHFSTLYGYIMSNAQIASFGEIEFLAALESFGVVQALCVNEL